MRFTITSEATGRSIVLRDQRNENEIGVWLLEDGVSGWFGTPAPREDPVSRLMSDGDYLPDALTQGSRIVTLHGYAAFGTTIECAAFVDRINSFMCQRVTVICDDAHRAQDGERVHIRRSRAGAVQRRGIASVHPHNHLSRSGEVR